MTTVHPLFPALDDLLREAAPGAKRHEITEVVATRVSTKSRKKLHDHYKEGELLYADHPIVGPWLAGLPEDVLLHPLDSYRLAHGLRRVELRHCHREETRSALVGYMGIASGPGGHILVLLIAHSASKEEIDTADGPVNAWTEVVLGSWKWAEAARKLRFQRDDRMNRSNLVFAHIDAAVKARPGARYYWGEKEVNPHTDSWSAIVQSNKSSEEAEAGKVRRIAGVLRKLQTGGWVQSCLPPGLRFQTSEDIRGNAIDDRTLPLVPDTAQAEELTSVLMGYAAGASQTRLAVAAASLGARNAEGRLLLPTLIPVLDEQQRGVALEEATQLNAQGIITDTELGWVRDATAVPSTPDLRAKATQAANHYVGRIVGAEHLRTGVYRETRLGVTKGRTDYVGWLPTFIVAEDVPIPEGEGLFVAEGELEPTHGYWAMSSKRREAAQQYGLWYFPLEYGSPVKLPLKVWEQIAIRSENDAEMVRRRSTAARARPLAGLTSSAAEGERFRIRHGGDSETYSIEKWTGTDENGHWTHAHTVGATHAAHQLGCLVSHVVESVEDGPLPLLPTLRTDVSVASAAELELRKLEKELETLTEVTLPAYARQLTNAAEGSRDWKAITTAKAEDVERADELEDVLIPAARALVDAEPGEDAIAADQEEAVGVGHLALVGFGLERCNPHGSRELSDAVTWMLDSGRGLSNLRRGTTDRQLLIDVQIRVPMSDGSTEWIDASVLDLTDRRLAPDRSAGYRADATDRYLRAGESLASLQARFDWPAGKVMQQVARRLAELGMENSHLRAAAVTSAAVNGSLPVGPVIHAQLSDDCEALGRLREEHGVWIVDAVVDAYGPGGSWAHGSGWVRKQLWPWRGLMLTLADHGPARTEDVLASVDGITNLEQLKDHLHPGRTSHWQPPARLEGGWVHPHRCAHRDCPGGPGAPLTGFLPVPELLVGGNAVFCTRCWRSPGSAERLPDVYRLQWDVRVDISSLGRADGIPEILQPSASTVPDPLLDTREAARLLGTSVHHLTALADSDLVSSTKTTGGKLRFRRSVVESSRSQAISGGSSPVGQADDAPLLGTKAAASLFGTTPYYVRFLVRSGALENLGTRAAPAYDRDAIDSILEQVRRATNDAEATLANLIPIKSLADRWGFTTSLVKNMIKEGVLDEVVLGSAVQVTEASVLGLSERTLGALDPANRLAVSDVARLAGISPATVTHHAATGNLPSIQFYPRGKYFFVPDEVNEWLRQRQAKRA